MNLSKPKTWKAVKISTLVTYVIGGDWGKDINFDSSDYAIALCIRGTEFRNWYQDKGLTASLRKIKKSSIANRTLKDGDILVEISGGGPDQPVGRTVLIDKTVLSHSPDVPKICTNFVRLLRTTNEINSAFLNLYLTFFYKSGEIRAYQAGSNNLRNLKFNDYLELEIPFPPLPEQHRIIAKIEKLFTELDKGIESLKTARTQLKVYRQALLKHAFEGKLTTQWRAENQDKLETAEALLKRIQLERQQRYRQQLAQWEATGKKRNKPKAPQVFPPLTAAEQAELPKLSKGWQWCKLADFIVSIDAGKSFKCDEREPFLDEIGVAKVSAVTWGEYDESESKTCVDRLKENESYFIRNGDFILSRANTIDLVGACVIARKVTKRIMLSDKTLRIVFDGFKQEYFLEYLRSQHGRDQIMKLSTGNQESMRNIGQDRIRSIAIPICSEIEAETVIESLASNLSEADQLNQSITTSLQQAEALRQSILKKAFSGQLVGQDANDEPASILLARIKAEKTTQVTTIKMRKPQQIHSQSEPVKSNVIPFPVRIANISTTDLHAGILARAYQHHEHTPKYLSYFGHVKAEKIAHLVEAHLGIDLGREPVKDAAGPNDYPHLKKKVEPRAQKANWFNVHQKKDGGAYVFTKADGFDTLLAKTRLALGDQATAVDELLALLLPLNTRQAEVVATLYAGWNNLLLLGRPHSDEEIVRESRENWHADKLNIERGKFFRGLEWMRSHGLVPVGRGRYVGVKEKSKTTRKPT